MPPLMRVYKRERTLERLKFKSCVALKDVIVSREKYSLQNLLILSNRHRIYEFYPSFLYNLVTLNVSFETLKILLIINFVFIVNENLETFVNLKIFYIKMCKMYHLLRKIENVFQKTSI